MSAFDPRPFGKYFLIAELNKTPFYTDYKAKTYGAKGFEKILLLRHLHSEKVSPEFIKKLTEEFQKVVKVSHPNVVPVYDFGCVKDDYFLTQEFSEIITFADYLDFFRTRGESVPLQQSLYLINEVLKGLQAAHNKFEASATLVHGNVNPLNLVISREAEVKVTGFGWERVAKEAGVSATTQNYYDQTDAQQKNPFRLEQDLYQVALVLFELVSGEPLLKRLPEDSGQNQIPESFLEKHVDKKVLSILQKAFATDEKERYPTALQMSVDVQRLLYATFPEFSSTEILDALQNFFSDKPKREKKPETFERDNTLKELVKSSQHQINFAHREGTEYSVLMADTVAMPKMSQDFFPDTDSVELSAVEFLDPSSEFERTENTGVYDEETSRKEFEEEKAIHKKSSGKKPNFKNKNLLILLVAGVALLIVLLVAVARNSVDPYWQNTGEVTDSTTFQAVIRSHPSGAEVWIDGENTGKLTPAQFSNLSSQESFELVLKKSGYEDFVDTLTSSEGQDQVLDIALKKGES